MHGLKILLGTTALLAGLAIAPATQAQVVVQIGVQPVCSYGYYGYAPYQCAPMGYYGPGYFYNGIFLGMGPWGGWGYSHGWGNHRFVNEGGGNYHGGPGRASYRETSSPSRGGSQARLNSLPSGPGGVRPSPGRPATHAAPSHPSAPRAQAAHSEGGGGHAGGNGEKH
jgi:hypothetical protein